MTCFDETPEDVARRMRQLAEGVADPTDSKAIKRYADWLVANPDAAEFRAFPVQIVGSRKASHRTQMRKLSRSPGALPSAASDGSLAVGLLKQSDIDRLGSQFTTLWPVSDTPCFGALLDAIDQADREFRRDEDASGRLIEGRPDMLIIRANGK